jgi:hypothetical protein
LIGGKVQRENGLIGGKIQRENGLIGGKIQRENGLIGGKIQRENGLIGGKIQRENGLIGGKIQRIGVIIGGVVGGGIALHNGNHRGSHLAKSDHIDRGGQLKSNQTGQMARCRIVHSTIPLVIRRVPQLARGGEKAGGEWGVVGGRRNRGGSKTRAARLMESI